MKPPRRSVATISVTELRERLARARVALEAAKRAPRINPKHDLVAFLTREIQILERDIVRWS
jgi:hypothetical protein